MEKSKAALLFRNIYNYIEGYKKAADMLVSAHSGTSSDANTLVYPIFFLYRHSIELSLKHLVRCFSTLAKKDKDLRSHDLRKMWTCLKQLLKDASEEGKIPLIPASPENITIDDLLNSVKQIAAGILPPAKEIELNDTNLKEFDGFIFFFAQLDAHGETFRYPDGKNFPERSLVDPDRAKANVLKLSEFFDGAWVLYDYLCEGTAYFNDEHEF